MPPDVTFPKSACCMPWHNVWGGWWCDNTSLHPSESLEDRDQALTQVQGAASLMMTTSFCFCVSLVRVRLPAAGNAVIQNVAVTQYGMALHLPTWAARDVERLKLTADAKMRTAYRMFPAAMRQLHAWRLLTPAYNAVGAIGRQVRQRCLQQSCAAASTEIATLAYSRLCSTGFSALAFPGSSSVSWSASLLPAAGCPWHSTSLP